MTILKSLNLLRPILLNSNPNRIIRFNSNVSTETSKTQINLNLRMKIQFTCQAKDSKTSKICNTRNDHEFSKLAYEKGIVLVQCPTCQNRHLIADHLSWFTNNSTSNDPNFKNDYRNIVELMKSKGEKVKRGKLSNQNGEVLEYYND